MHQCRRVYKQLIDAVGGEESDVIKSANSTLLEITFINGSQILFKSVEMGEAIRGISVKNSLLVIDEGAYCPDNFYFTIDPITDATKSPVLLISTPCFKSGEFYERYMRGINGSDFVESFNWGNYDTSIFLPPAKLEYYRQTMTPLKFKSEILGEFIEEGSYLFGDITKNYGYSKKEPKYVGIDWASGSNSKDDYSCMVFLDEDCAMVDIKFWKVIDPMDMVATMAGVINATPTLNTVLVEKNSLGEVYRSALQKALKNKAVLQSFVTSNDSKREIIEELIKAFSENSITILDEPRLREQLQHYQIEQTPTGKVTYNAESGYNDDAVMALAIAYKAARKNKGTVRFNIK